MAIKRLKYDPDDSIPTLDLGEERMVRPSLHPSQSGGYPNLFGTGTSEGAEKGWDERGRGRKTQLLKAAVREWQINSFLIMHGIDDLITGRRGLEYEITPQEMHYAAEILDGIRHGDTFDSDSLFRGISVDPDNDKYGILKLKKGDEFTRTLGFSQNRRVAFDFANMGGKIVVFRNVGKVRGLDISKISQRFQNFPDGTRYEEQEVITEGRFKVVEINTYGKITNIAVQQLDVL